MQGRVDCSVRPHHRQIYLAKEEYEKLKKWAEDDLPFQPIESTINLATGKEGYSDFNSFHTEKSANLSLSPTQLLTARGVTRLLRGKVVKARSDREEAMSRAGADGETVVAYAIATSPRPPNKDEGEEWWRYVPLTSVQTCAMADPRFIVNWHRIF